MRIKVVGSITSKNLALILMKTMAQKGIHEVSGASLYFGTGDEVIAISAGGDEIPSNHFTNKPAKKHPKKKKPPVDSWPARQDNISKQPIADDVSLPWTR
jgi:hypothetical protein